VPTVTPADALDRLLRQLGLPGEEIPTDIEHRAVVYRDRLRTKELLVFLDDVSDVEQVLPLLPAAPSCHVVITSRIRLGGLDDALHVQLDTLPREDAAALFRTVVGNQRPLGGADAARRVDAIVDCCGRLPLAIRIAAARYRDNPSWTLSDIERRLTNREARLDELDDGTRSVTSVLASSYRELPSTQRRMSACLSLHPGADIDVPAAAAVAGVDVAVARQALDSLVRAHLLEEGPAGRYGCHDLLRAFAARVRAAEINESERDAARRRLVDYYLTAANAADTVLTPHRHRLPLDILATPAALPEPRSYGEALAWLDTEFDNLMSVCRLASERHLNSSCWLIAYTLRGYLFLTKKWDAWVEMHELALGAARSDGDVRAEAHTLNNLGLAHIERGDIDASSSAYERALNLFREQGDQHGAMTSLSNLAWVHFYRGDYQAALANSEVAHAFYVRDNNRRNAAITLRGIGLAELWLGGPLRAITCLNEALAEFADLGLDLDSAMTLNGLGEAYLMLNEPRAARRSHRKAITLSRRCGSGFEEARAHEGLGACAEALGDDVRRFRYWQLALAGYARLNAPHTERLRAWLSSKPAVRRSSPEHPERCHPA
jgi:tetratricopeptide (TPR) repeat protein